MKSLKELLTEGDVSSQSLQMFKRLIDQNYKNPEDKIKAMSQLAALVLGPDVKKLATALMSPPPLPMGTSTSTTSISPMDTSKIQN